jgi:hypothetical protein
MNAHNEMTDNFMIIDGRLCLTSALRPMTGLESFQN